MLKQTHSLTVFNYSWT